MSEEEFKSLIKFESVSLGNGRTQRRASVSFGRTIVIDNMLDRKHGVIKQADEQLTEDLLRRVYTDRREELYHAIAELHKTHPIGPGYHTAIENILKIAKRQ